MILNYWTRKFINDNVLRYGAIEIPKEEYMKMLKSGLKNQAKV